MAKRVADKYLTDQNWDQDDREEEEVGEPGVFQKADEEVLKKRVIRKAKRRVTPGQTSETSAFSGFSGLKAPVYTGTTGGFNLHGNSGIAVKAFSLPVQPLTATTPGEVNAKPSANTNKQSALSPKVVGTKSSDEDEVIQTSSEYNRHLSALNKSVSDWIKNHVEKNPLCDLTPIFLDYKKYLTEIDEKYGHSDSEGSQNSARASDSQETTSPKTAQELSRAPIEAEKPKFTLTGFGSKPNPPAKDSNERKEVDAPASRPLFTGFQTTTTATTTSPFKGFNVSKGSAYPGFSFTSSMVGAENNVTQKDNKQNDEDEYVPPKPESNVIQEEGAFFSIRCKLYYKKDDSYADRGVGQLYLKPSGEKTQLLIRADTAISQILLNILLVPSMPLQKQGKNNILIMCIPNPPIIEKEKDKVMTLLIRVKTSEDADKLLEVLEQKKKENGATE